MSDSSSRDPGLWLNDIDGSIDITDEGVAWHLKRPKAGVYRDFFLLVEQADSESARKAEELGEKYDLGHSLYVDQIYAPAMVALVSRCGGPEDITADDLPPWLLNINAVQLIATHIQSLPLRSGLTEAQQEMIRQATTNLLS